ncbi:c-type cytochrome [methanotrophic endosymbiont of Bathymodiolus puteoserpentis (Logatchev)]|jgi:cytochrome c553|uniref:c-type cytochrome n=1 Tax=methanotrophic endosymbiont of Bathymodiolus puteoserpentis (Logatchev) TaxID=343235 RepID=UPI0013C68CF9|nr:cytochrome c [methanotrophic endosymbiont of Bathymodiolus puteoserpentis (Logatchev)]SHE19480.1 Cytochrome c4 [methanotrophic endosymbiont of Bathymodiolus puteoserpentis (Logatchev)]
MKLLTYLLATLLVFSINATSQAASIYAGKSKAAAVCSQCHGIRKTSAEAPFPPLAGRDEEYMENALKQYRNKTRVSEIMNNIAGSLSDRDINNIASYYSRLKP